MSPSKPSKKKTESSEGSLVGIDVRNLSRDAFPYSKADVARVCRLDEDFAVSFYQINYQFLVDQIVHEGKSKNPPEVMTIPVAKVVMNRRTYSRLIVDLLTIAEKVGLSIDDIRQISRELNSDEKKTKPAR